MLKQRHVIQSENAEFKENETNFFWTKNKMWELAFVHYIAKFAISSFVISRFECSTILHDVLLHKLRGSSYLSNP